MAGERAGWVTPDIDDSAGFRMLPSAMQFSRSGWMNVGALVWVVLGGLLLSDGVAEPWTLRNGQQLDASVRMVREKRVTLRLEDGRELKLGVDSLAADSRRRVEQWARGQGGDLEFASWIQSPDSAFSRPWPKSVYGPNNPEIRVVADKARPRRYIYESEHYRFVSDAMLDRYTVRKFATLFETTYAYNMALPLNVPARYHAAGRRYLVYLFSDEKTYRRYGGIEGAAGVYDSRRDAVLVPFRSLGLSQMGKKWKWIKGRENPVIGHELTHQLMVGIRPAPWFTEGCAEYVAQTRYTHGKYHVHGSQRRLFDSVISKKASKKHFSRQLGPRERVPSLQAFMEMPYGKFTAAEDANLHYGVALMLTFYFYHVDGSGKGHNIKRYIKALQRGQTEAEARRALLNGREYRSVQTGFASFCASQGLRLEFEK